jgi:hypothetical protein
VFSPMFIRATVERDLHALNVITPAASWKRYHDPKSGSASRKIISRSILRKEEEFSRRFKAHASKCPWRLESRFSGQFRSVMGMPPIGVVPPFAHAASPLENCSIFRLLESISRRERIFRGWHATSRPSPTPVKSCYV